MTFTTGLPLKTKIKTNVTKEEILAKASDLISNDRNKSHGDAFNNHAEIAEFWNIFLDKKFCLLYTSPSPRDGLLSRMPSSA